MNKGTADILDDFSTACLFALMCIGFITVICWGLNLAGYIHDVNAKLDSISLEHRTYTPYPMPLVEYEFGTSTKN